MFVLFVYLQVVGGPCGYHGPYTFYKGIRIAPIGTSYTQAPYDSLTSDFNYSFNHGVVTINPEIKSEYNAITLGGNLSSSGRNGW